MSEITETALVIAVEARTLARQAHERQDAMDRSISRIHTTLGELQTSVAKLNTKVGMAAAMGSLIGGGIIAAVTTLILK